jgi:hypothetical protein
MSKEEWEAFFHDHSILQYQGDDPCKKAEKAWRKLWVQIAMKLKLADIFSIIL